MTYTTSIAGATGIVDRYNASAGGPGIRADAMPVSIRQIPIDNITVGERVLHRHKDDDYHALVTDIRAHGLLQPIGVQQVSGTPNYQLVYGRRRLMAWQEGWANAQKLLHAKGVNDVEAVSEAKAWQMIPCIVYDADMPKTIALLKELAENLFRRALKKPEVEEHRVKYASILKKLKLVVSAVEKRAESKRGSHPTESGEQPKPTTMQKLVTDLGIGDDQIAKDFASISRRAQGVAKASGMEVPKPITTESSPEKIDEVVALAELQTEARKEAEAKGEDPRKVLPAQPATAEVITVRIDVTDPEKLLEWFRMKLKDTNKPLSLKFLRGLHQGLGRLISEHPHR